MVTGRTPQLALVSICSGKLFKSISSYQTPTVEVSPVKQRKCWPGVELQVLESQINIRGLERNISGGRTED